MECPVNVHSTKPQTGLLVIKLDLVRGQFLIKYNLSDMHGFKGWALTPKSGPSDLNFSINKYGTI